MKALVGAFNQEKALVGAFSVIVQPVEELMEHYTALVPVLDRVLVHLSEPPVGLLPGGELILSIAVRVSRFGHGQDGAKLSLFN